LPVQLGHNPMQILRRSAHALPDNLAREQRQRADVAVGRFDQIHDLLRRVAHAVVLRFQPFLLHHLRADCGNPPKRLSPASRSSRSSLTKPSSLLAWEMKM
jgi:hypothetical protein